MGTIKDIKHSGNDKQACCDGDHTAEVTAPVIKVRLRLCSACSCFDIGECKMLTEPLAVFIRKEGSKCPVSVW